MIKNSTDNFQKGITYELDDYQKEYYDNIEVPGIGECKGIIMRDQQNT